MSEQKVRLNVRLELDDSLDQGTAVIDGHGDEVVVRINSNPWASMLMAVHPQVSDDFIEAVADPVRFPGLKHERRTPREGEGMSFDEIVASLEAEEVSDE